MQVPFNDPDVTDSFADDELASTWARAGKGRPLWQPGDKTDDPLLNARLLYSACECLFSCDYAQPQPSLTRIPNSIPNPGPITCPLRLLFLSLSLTLALLPQRSPSRDICVTCETLGPSLLRCASLLPTFLERFPRATLPLMNLFLLPCPSRFSQEPDPSPYPIPSRTRGAVSHPLPHERGESCLMLPKLFLRTCRRGAQPSHSPRV